MPEQVLPMITCCQAVKLAFEKTCIFRGRAKRSEYWFYFLFFQVIVFILAIIYLILFLDSLREIIRNQRGLNGAKEKISTPFPLIGFIILVFIVISLSVPLLSLSVRRLHDTGKSGFFLFLLFIPLGGLIIIIIFLVLDSQRSTNEYGPSVKYIIITNDPLLTDSRFMSVSENPYFNPQIYSGDPMPYPYPNDAYQQFPQINQSPQAIEKEFIVGEKNQQIVKPGNLDIIEQKNIPTTDGQNLKIIEEQNQQIFEQQSQQINEQENQQIDEQQNKKEDN